MSKMKEHLAKLDYFDGVKAENKRICEALKAELPKDPTDTGIMPELVKEDAIWDEAYERAQQDMLKWIKELLK